MGNTEPRCVLATAGDAGRQWERCCIEERGCSVRRRMVVKNASKSRLQTTQAAMETAIYRVQMRPTTYLLRKVRTSFARFLVSWTPVQTKRMPCTEGSKLCMADMQETPKSEARTSSTRSDALSTNGRRFGHLPTSTHKQRLGNRSAQRDGCVNLQCPSAGLKGYSFTRLRGCRRCF